MKTYEIISGGKQSSIVGSNLSLEMEMTILSPKKSLCYTIDCTIVETNKHIKIVLHDKAAIGAYRAYVATMINKEEEKQECIIIDTKEKIILTIP